MLVGVPMTYFLIAPSRMMGWNAGATGLAIKMVVQTVLAVNVQLYFNTKYLNLSFRKFVFHQVIVVGTLLLIACASTFGIDMLVSSHQAVITRFLLSGILYTAVSLFLFYHFPRAIGLNKQDMRDAVLYVKTQISR